MIPNKGGKQPTKTQITMMKIAKAFSWLTNPIAAAIQRRKEKRLKKAAEVERDLKP